MSINGKPRGLGNQVTAAQAQTVVCPNCNAQPDKPCTQPTDTGRSNVSWVHLARESEYMKQREGGE